MYFQVVDKQVADKMPKQQWSIFCGWTVALRFPYPEETILRVGAQEVLVRVLSDPNHILLVHVEGPLQLACGRGEAVEDEVLPHAVDPLSPRRERAADEVTPCSLSRRKWSHNLTLGKEQNFNPEKWFSWDRVLSWGPACSWWQRCLSCCTQPSDPCSLAKCEQSWCGHLLQQHLPKTWRCSGTLWFWCSTPFDGQCH